MDGKKPKEQKLNDYSDVLSVKDICALLNVNSKTVCKLLSEGTIKSFKVGRLHKVTKSNIRKFINGKS